MFAGAGKGAGRPLFSSAIATRGSRSFAGHAEASVANRHRRRTELLSAYLNLDTRLLQNETGAKKTTEYGVYFEAVWLTLNSLEKHTVSFRT